MDLKDIKELILAIDKTSIAKVEIEKEDMKINIYKNNLEEVHRSKKTEDIYLYEDKKAYIEKEILEDENIGEDEDFFIQKSPIVGVFYSSSSPDSDSFVELGKRVKKGDILCIVEAMKIMNEIEAEVDGEVVEIYAQDEDIIEYGQDLIKLRRI